MNLPKSIAPKLISQFEKATGLTFINDDKAEGNVCYANNSKLRPEFKSTFRKKDIKNYILGLQQSQNITVPHDADTFWKIVGLGKGLKGKIF
jgi:hypothetical protein